MSMSNFTIYGFGFNCTGFDRDCNKRKLIDFIKNHKEAFCKTDDEKELYKEMLDYTEKEKEYDVEDFFENYECDSNGLEGVGAVIANIMSRETGIRFDYCQPDEDCDTLASVVFVKSYPWLLNETEKELTEEKLSNICQKYMDELGITDIPDDLNLEYYI